MSLLRPLRACAVLVAGVTAAAVLWLAASPPATSTVAPGAAAHPWTAPVPPWSGSIDPHGGPAARPALGPGP